MLVEFEVTSDQALREIYVDLRGDGLDGWHYTGGDLETIRAVAVRPQKTGTFELELTAWTHEGCSDRTGTRRILEVTR